MRTTARARNASVEEVRAFYAASMAAAGRRPHWPQGYAFEIRLEGAFEAVPREMFLPPGPWHVETGAGHYIETPSADLRYLYRDVSIAIDRRGGINSGQPSGHAQFMGRLEPRPGETVVHIGAATGYYTAVLSMLVAPGGRVAAFEVDCELARWARRNLHALDNVSFIAGNAAMLAVPDADVFYVNAGVLAPPVHWLMALRPGGRMFLPWRPAAEIGVALFIHRTPIGFAAEATTPTWFMPCPGATSGALKERKEKPPDLRAIMATRSLHLTAERPPDATATAIYRRLWFSSRALEAAAETRLA
jgi:protein-L-isoaspartate(D-aspartate) O-methyltransferase